MIDESTTTNHTSSCLIVIQNLSLVASCLQVFLMLVFVLFEMCFFFRSSMPLIFTTLWANSADDKLTIFFFLFSPKNRLLHFKQIVSYNLHEIVKTFYISSKLSPAICMKYQSLFSGENKKKYYKMSSAVIFTQHAEH